MTRDDIIRMAQEACDKDKVDAWQNGFWVLTQEEVERFFHMAQAAEREACAKDLDELSKEAEDIYAKGFVWKAIKKSAAVIRARGQA